MTHGSLFSGIGGFDLAAEWMGWKNVLHCEINPFGRKILNYYWPNAISYEDITKTDFIIHRGAIDILTGGFPCQPFSLAGKRKGTADDRHLWPEMLRAIREIQPRWIVGENVSGLVNWDAGLVFDQVQADLEAEGYEVTPFLLPAAGVNAPHKRERIWFVAYNTNTGNESLQRSRKNGISKPEFTANAASPRINRAQEHENNNKEGREWRRCNIDNSCKIQGGNVASYSENIGLQSAGNTRNRRAGFKDGGNGIVTNPDSSIGRKRRMHQTESEQAKRHISTCDSRNYWCGTWDNFPTQPPICSRDDGISYGLDGITFSKWRNESIKAYGNAIVPQVVYQIFKAIQEYDNRNYPDQKD